LVLCCSNLKAADCKGVVSAGRCLVATGADKKEMVHPPAGAKVGERVVFAGVTNTDEPCSSKIFSKILKGLKTGDDRVLQCLGAEASCSSGVLSVPSVAGGTVA